MLLVLNNFIKTLLSIAYLTTKESLQAHATLVYRLGKGLLEPFADTSHRPTKQINPFNSNNSKLNLYPLNHCSELLLITSVSKGAAMQTSGTVYHWSLTLRRVSSPKANKPSKGP